MKNTIITEKKLTDWGACSDGKAWAVGVIGKGMDLTEMLPLFERTDWMLWLLRKTEELTKVQYVELAVICAKTVLHIYEKEYPKDDRPRKAIEAAIRYCEYPSAENRKAADASASAADAAAASAYAASASASASAYAASASASASDAAADAAYAASASASAASAASAADAAADAAYAASASASAASAADAAARKKHHEKMCALLLERIESWGDESQDGRERGE